MQDIEIIVHFKWLLAIGLREVIMSMIDGLIVLVFGSLQRVL